MVLRNSHLLQIKSLAQENNVFKSAQGATTSISKETIKTAKKKLASPTNMKTALKHATKYTFHEVEKQCVNAGMNYIIDAEIGAIFTFFLEKAFKDTVTSSVKQNAELGLSLTEYIRYCRALQNHINYKIDSKLEQITNLLKVMTKYLILGLMTDATKSQVSEVISRLSEGCNNATDLVAKSGTHCTAKRVKISAEIDKP